mmetsp:Transcript_7737/g.23241  ORF Transcript_7737/g.23241 Transcript_7737/m.23241 type:complete len:251 (-) Transcript_7737:753-1505(-)
MCNTTKWDRSRITCLQQRARLPCHCRPRPWRQAVPPGSQWCRGSAAAFHRAVPAPSCACPAAPQHAALRAPRALHTRALWRPCSRFPPPTSRASSQPRRAPARAPRRGPQPRRAGPPAPPAQQPARMPRQPCPQRRHRQLHRALACGCRGLHRRRRCPPRCQHRRRPSRRRPQPPQLRHPAHAARLAACPFPAAAFGPAERAPRTLPRAASPAARRAPRAGIAAFPGTSLLVRPAPSSVCAQTSCEWLGT